MSLFRFFVGIIIASYFILSSASAAECTDTKTALNTVTYNRLSDAKGKPDGYYEFDFGNGKFLAYVEDDWVLMLSYHSDISTDPNLSYREPGDDWPTYVNSGPGANNCGSQIRQTVGQTIPDSSVKLRWYGATSGHSRIMHFESPLTSNWFNKGGAAITGIASSFTALSGHTANLPASRTHGPTGSNDTFFNHEPFYVASLEHWNINFGSNRWEVDDAGNNSNQTVHRIWVQSNDAATTPPNLTSSNKVYVDDIFGQNLKAIPGNDMVFQRAVQNEGGAVDSGSLTMTFNLGSNMAFRMNSVSFNDGQKIGSFPGDVEFDYDSINSSGLSVNTITYSNNNGTSFVYTPSADITDSATGYQYDSNVTNIRVTTTGAMNDGTSSPTGFRIYYMTRIL